MALQDAESCQPANPALLGISHFATISQALRLPYLVKPLLEPGAWVGISGRPLNFRAGAPAPNVPQELVDADFLGQAASEVYSNQQLKQRGPSHCEIPTVQRCATACLKSWTMHSSATEVYSKSLSKAVKPLAG